MQNLLNSAYFNLLIKFIFFPENLESSGFRFITLNPHETQVDSYSYRRIFFPPQYPHFFPFS